MRHWVNPEFGNFDNILIAVLTLFEMSGLEMWPDVMYHGMDAYKEDEAPRRDASAGTAIFFILWIFVGALFINNLVVGVVIDNFNQIKDQENGSAFLTSEQKDWVDTITRSSQIKPQKTHRPGFTGVRLKLWELIRSNAFEVFILVVIMLNVAMMATYNCVPDAAASACIIEPLWAAVWRYSNYMFSLIFVGEMVIKLAALHCNYFKEGWNCFDFFLVAVSIVDLILEIVGSGGQSGFNPTILRVLRIFRVARLLRLVRQAKGIRLLLTTLVSSLPSLFNVASLLLLLLFVFAILGVNLFSEVTTDGDFITKHANFQTFFQALLLLFRCVTGESWNGIMHDAMIVDVPHPLGLHNPNRCDSAAGTCGSPVAAIIYFIFFTLIGGFVMLNLVIAVILENFSGLASEDEQAPPPAPPAPAHPSTLPRPRPPPLPPPDPSVDTFPLPSREQVVPDSLIEEFREEWAKLDPDGDGHIPSVKLTTLLRRVCEPLGFRSQHHGGVVMHRKEQMARLRELNIPDHEGLINFQEARRRRPPRAAAAATVTSFHVHVHGLPATSPSSTSTSGHVPRASRRAAAPSPFVGRSCRRARASRTPARSRRCRSTWNSPPGWACRWSAHARRRAPTASPSRSTRTRRSTRCSCCRRAAPRALPARASPTRALAHALAHALVHALARVARPGGDPRPQV